MIEYPEIKKILLNHKKAIQDKYQVNEIGVFGSYLKNKQTSTSDLDILINYNSLPDLFEFINLKNYLSDILKIPVDLVLKDSLKPNIGAQILSEVELI